MNFKGWLILAEGIETPYGVKAALITYKNNPNDEDAKRNFYSEIINFVKTWYRRKKCADTGVSLDELTSTIYTKLIDKINNPEINFLTSLRPETFIAYLSTITKNNLVDAIRKRIRNPSLSLEKKLDNSTKTLGATIPSKDPSLEDEAIRSDDNKIIKDIVSKLSNIDKEIFDLVYRKSLKYPEIAEKLGIPLGTVKSRVSNLVKRVKKSFDKQNQ